MRAFKLFQWRPRLLYTRHNLGPGFGWTETALTPCLTDAVMKGVKVRGRLLWDGMWVLVQPKSCSCSGTSVVQSCRKYRSSLLWPYLYSLINGLTMSYQMGCMSGPVGSYPYRCRRLDCLILIWGFGWRCYCGDVCGLKLKYTTLCVLAESGSDIYFPRDFS